MIKYFCDRCCGEVLSFDNLVKIYYITNPENLPNFKNCTKSRMSICTNCAVLLKEFFNIPINQRAK